MDYFEHLQRRLDGKEEYVPARLGDKHLIRRFADLIGVRTTEIYFRGKASELMKFNFPHEFVLKPAFASTSIGVMLLSRSNEDNFLDLLTHEEYSLQDIVEKCENISKRYFEGRGEVGTFLVEELLRDADGSTPPQDIRFYTFQGEIGMILKEDHMTGSAAKAMYFDGNFLPFSDVTLRYSVAEKAKHLEEIIEARTPANWRELLSVAKRISVAVPSAFVRVDLYDTPGRVTLGEVTFFPGTFYYRDRKIMSASEAERLGRMWDEAATRLSGSLNHKKQENVFHPTPSP